MSPPVGSGWIGEGVGRPAQSALNVIIDSLSRGRIGSVPLLNAAVVAAYLVAVFSLSIWFRTLYSIFALGTTALTNLLLFGLSDSLAQTLRVVAAQRARDAGGADDLGSPFLSYVLDHGRQRAIVLDEAGDDLAELGLASTGHREPSIEEQFPIPRFDFRRLVLFSSWGLLVSLVQSPWYKFLNTAYTQDVALVTVIQRVLADQLFYSPIMMAVFLSYLTVTVEHGDSNAVKETLAKRYLPTLAVNMCVWPPAQFVNFLVVPTSIQIPFSSSLSVIWNTYLSLNTS